jgi:hypothetical protein
MYVSDIVTDSGRIRTNIPHIFPMNTLSDLYSQDFICTTTTE